MASADDDTCSRLHLGREYAINLYPNCSLFTKNLPAQTFNALADFVTGRRGDYSAEPLVTDDGRAMLIYLALLVPPSLVFGRTFV